MSQEDAPMERVTSEGETEFAQARLRADARALLGVGPNVVAGALHGVDKTYLTIKEAKVLVKSFLGRPV